MKIAIAGAGIAGLTAAVALKKENIDTVLFEASPEIRSVGAGLTLAANALKALDFIGLKDELVHRGQLLNKLTITDHHGKLITRVNSRNSSRKSMDENFAIHRADLHALLMEQLPRESVHTGKKLVSVKQNAEHVKLLFQDGSSYCADYVIAADGIHSVTRKEMLPDSAPRYAGYTCWRGVAENMQLKMPDACEIWGPKGRFGIVPMKDNIYWFACINSQQNNPDAKSFDVQDLLRQFEGYPADVKTVLEKTKDEDLLWNDIFDLKPINRFAFDRVVLIGDAAHATTPNMGQGACQAIEDAVWLAEAMAGKPDFQQVFRDFETSRMKRVHWVTRTSWKLGKAGQVTNPVLGAMRNFMLRITPPSVNEKQLAKLYEVQFPNRQ